MIKLNNFFIRLKAKSVGKDQFGNEYFVARQKNYLGQNTRYVIYNGIEEGSKIPPNWHGWLHYSVDDTPEEQKHLYKWQKCHIPNLTGTKKAYNKKMNKNNGYLAWKP